MSLESTAPGSFIKTTQIRHFRRLLSRFRGDFRKFVYILRQTGGHFKTIWGACRLKWETGCLNISIDLHYWSFYHQKCVFSHLQTLASLKWDWLCKCMVICCIGSYNCGYFGSQFGHYFGLCENALVGLNRKHFSFPRNKITVSNCLANV